MRTHLRARIVSFVAVPLFLLAIVPPAWSQAWDQSWNESEPGFAKRGGFVGVSFVPDFTFDGVTFDGETAYKQVDGEEIVILPRVDARNLVRLALGYRGRQAAIEVSYDRTGHTGTFLDLPGKATFQAVNVDGRYFFAPRSRVQPHVLVGGTIPWFKVKDGSFLEGDVADASFKGYGVNSEAGVTIYPHRRFGVSVGYNYRVLWFDRVTGVSDTLFELRPRFRETSGAVIVTSHVIF